MTQEVFQSLFSIPLTKGKFYRLYDQLLLNRTRTWECPESFERSGFTGLVGFRDRQVGGKTVYGVTPDQVRKVWRRYLRAGRTPVIQEQVPHDKLTLNAESIWTAEGLALLWSHETLPMKEALAKRSLLAVGLRSLAVVRQFLDPSSFEDWLLLEEMFPGSVVEFSCFSVPVGILSRKTVFWEVRYY